MKWWHHLPPRSLCLSRCSYQKTRIQINQTKEIQFRAQLRRQSRKTELCRERANSRNAYQRCSCKQTRPSRKRLKRSPKLQPQQGTNSILRHSKDSFQVEYLVPKESLTMCHLIRSRPQDLRNKKSWLKGEERAYMSRMKTLILIKRPKRKLQSIIMPRGDRQELRGWVKNWL